MAQKNRPGATRKKKGPVVGSGGQRRKGLEGRGPTPKAEDRVYHKAYKAKQAVARKQQNLHRRPSRTGAGPIKEDLVTGRNAVLEALRAGVPAKTLFVATKIEMDDRVKDILQLCAEAQVPTLEASRGELDRLSADAIHQGVVLQVPPYDYQDADELAASLMADRGEDSRPPLLIAANAETLRMIAPRLRGSVIPSAAMSSGGRESSPRSAMREAASSSASW